MKLCIYSWFGYPIPTRERASMIREAGFDSVMIWWGDEYLPYTGEPKEVLYCVVTRLEVDKLKEIVLEKDENAFVTINAVHDIVGGRFKKKAIH